jgi:hypothetical protein
MSIGSFLLVVPGTLCAQVTPILRAGQAPSGLDPCCSIRFIQSVTANDLGGYAAVVLMGNSSIPLGVEPGVVWGSADQNPAHAMRSLTSTFPNHEAIYDRVVGLSAGGGVTSSVFLARNQIFHAQPPAGFIGSLMVKNTPMVIEGTPAEFDDSGQPIHYYGAIRKVGMTADGHPFWMGDLSPTPFGEPDATNIFLDSEDTWVTTLAGGDPVSPANITSGVALSGLHMPAIDGIMDFAISSRGARCAAIVHLAHDSGMTIGLLDGHSVFSAGGKRVVQSGPLPGNTGDFWLDLTHVAVNEAMGNHRALYFSGETYQNTSGLSSLGPIPRRFVIFRNGNAVVWSGTSMGGEVLSGPVEALATNMNADYAAVWGIRDGAGQALTMNGAIVLKTGDPVVVENTGPSADPITGTIAMLYAPVGFALGPRHSGILTAFVVASVNADNLPDLPTLDVLYRIDVQVAPATACAVDFNGDGILGVQDIFDFLNAWFADDPRADFNGVNGLEVEDVFDYLNAWFVGCD